MLSFSHPWTSYLAMTLQLLTVMLFAANQVIPALRNRSVVSVCPRKTCLDLPGASRQAVRPSVRNDADNLQEPNCPVVVAYVPCNVGM